MTPSQRLNPINGSLNGSLNGSFNGSLNGTLNGSLESLAQRIARFEAAAKIDSHDRNDNQEDNTEDREDRGDRGDFGGWLGVDRSAIFSPLSDAPSRVSLPEAEAALLQSLRAALAGQPAGATTHEAKGTSGVEKRAVAQLEGIVARLEVGTPPPAFHPLPLPSHLLYFIFNIFPNSYLLLSAVFAASICCCLCSFC